jgi:hypothetical protein
MNMLEQKFMEQVPSALLRIAKALEDINEKLDVLVQRTDLTRWEQQEPEPKPEAEQQDDVDYNELEEIIGSMRYGNLPARRALLNALYHRPQYVIKTAATCLSFCYSGVIIKQMEEAIENGEIQVIAPEMKDVLVSKRKDGQYVKETRRQPVGKYQVNLKSAVLWLESHGHRQVPADNPVYKCIEKIINS